MPISFQTDVWSFGMLCLEIMTGEKPFRNCRRVANVIEYLVAKRLPERPTEDIVVMRGLDTRLWDVLLACWRWEPLERPNMLEIHRWFKTLKPGDGNNLHGHTIPQKGEQAIGRLLLNVHNLFRSDGASAEAALAAGRT